MSVILNHSKIIAVSKKKKEERENQGPMSPRCVVIIETGRVNLRTVSLSREDPFALLPCPCRPCHYPSTLSRSSPKAASPYPYRQMQFEDVSALGYGFESGRTQYFLLDRTVHASPTRAGRNRPTRCLQLVARVSVAALVAQHTVPRLEAYSVNELMAARTNPEGRGDAMKRRM